MAEKAVEQQDPFALVQNFLDVPADDTFYRQMAQTFIEEYMLIGWSDEDIFGLFENPFYQSTHKILQTKGEEWVRKLIEQTRVSEGPNG